MVGVTLTYQEQIEAMQRLLEAPKANMTTFTDQSFKQDIATDPRSELATNYDELTTPQQDNKRIPIPEHVEPEQKKRLPKPLFPSIWLAKTPVFEEPISVQALEIMTPQKTG